MDMANTKDAYGESKDDADEMPDFQFERMVHKGVAMLKCEIDDIERMETRIDDIWVCSFPRSGRILYQYIRRKEKKKNRQTDRQTETDKNASIDNV
jgi:hypothetical protein